MKFALALPREALSIPVVRRVLGDALRALGVSDDCIGDILVAASEACTNAIAHARASGDFELVACVESGHCLLKIADDGRHSTGTNGALRISGNNSDNGPAASACGSPCTGSRSGPSAPAGQGSSASRSAARWHCAGQTGHTGHAGQAAAADDTEVDVSTLGESGRGIGIMRALVDDVTFDTRPGQGTVVHLQKRLTWRDEALLPRLGRQLVHSGG